MSEPLEVRLEDFKEWLEEETVSILEPIKDEAKNRLEGFNDRLEDLKAACEKLSEDAEKEMQKGSRKTYRRSRVAWKVASKILDTIDEASFPDEISPQSLQGFCENLENAFAAIGQERARWFPRISPFFIIDRRRVDVALQRAVDSFREFSSFSSAELGDAEMVQDALTTSDRLRDLLDDLKRLRTRKNRVESRKRTIEKAIADRRNKQEQIRSKSAVVELGQVNEEIEMLQRELSRSMHYLEKPFLKLQRLVQSPGFPLPLNEAKRLNQYLTDPFMAFATEKEGYPLLKEILRKLEEAIDQGKLKLKTSRLRKAKEQINEALRNDALIPLQQRCKETYSRKQSLSTSNTISTFQSRLEKSRRSLEHLEKKRKLNNLTYMNLNEKIEELLEEIERQRSGLEKTVEELTRRNVRLVLQ